MISHELRTPLSSILGYVELLEDDQDEPPTPQQTAYLRIVDRNARRLLRLVGDLLFTAQVDSGRFSVEKSPSCWSLCCQPRRIAPAPPPTPQG